MSIELTRTKPVIRCYNKPGIPEDLQARFTAEGLFVADFDTGWSLESEDVPSKKHRSAGGRTFNRIIDISRQGGIGLIRTPNDDDNIITVGEWEPNCATFREVDGTKLKGNQMSRFGLFVPRDGQIYSKLEEAYKKGGQTVDDVPDQEEILKEAIAVLEREGPLRKPAYL